MINNPFKNHFSCSVSIGMSEEDRIVQFILKSENIEFKYVQDAKVTPPPIADFENTVKIRN